MTKATDFINIKIYPGIEDLKKKMVDFAIKKHVDIYPTSDSKNLMDGFTIEKNHIIFWYNTKDRSTHIVSAEIDTGKIIEYKD
jgi:hypothetical protein